MNIKDVAQAITESYDGIECKVSVKHQQIKLKSAGEPGEVKILLSPYYQKKLKDGSFDAGDLGGVLEEVRTFVMYGL